MPKLGLINTIDEAVSWLNDQCGGGWSARRIIEAAMEGKLTLLASNPQWTDIGRGELPTVAPDGTPLAPCYSDGMVRLDGPLLLNLLNHGKTTILGAWITEHDDERVALDADNIPVIDFSHLRIEKGQLMDLVRLIFGHERFYSVYRKPLLEGTAPVQLKPVSQTEVIKLGPEVAEKLKSFGGDSSGNPAQNGNDQGTSLPDEGWLFPWIPKARELGEEVFSKHPKYSVLQIAEKVNVEMTRLSETEEKAKVIGRGGRVPSAGTIKRHALTGLTKPK